MELAKQKEVSAATEKLRRERWMAEHGKKIKEMTVKGLEPEIQRLIAKHKAEVQKIKVLHEVTMLLVLNSWCIGTDRNLGSRITTLSDSVR